MFGENPYSQKSFSGLNYSTGASPDYVSSGLTSSDMAGTLGTAGVGAAAGANPYVLAAYVGLSLLNQKAQDERAKRQRQMQIDTQYGENQNQALSNLGQMWGRALGK